VQTLFIDDLDGSAVEGTARFGLDGAEYEIDLNTEHAQSCVMRWRPTRGLDGGLAALPPVARPQPT
jgi:nucleoid-associated protein Lsr2